ncbi:MAG: 30S ribosomal protein S6 [Parachlamydiaceae bacterium]|nr:30S ribosomal protein S6 [Parachlamydiaceae bacterium]
MNPRQKRQNLYEGMYVISATLSDDARHKALDKIQTGITNHGGEIKKLHEQGRRRLAYDINGHRDGYYYLIYFTAPTSAISELWHEYHLNEDLIRFITLTTEKVMDRIEFKPLVEQQ